MVVVYIAEGSQYLFLAAHIDLGEVVPRKTKFLHVGTTMDLHCKYVGSIIGILLNCARCITNTRMWWRIMHSTSDERSESRVLCIILHHMRVLVIHLKQFTSICITFTLLNKQNLNLIHHHPW